MLPVAVMASICLPSPAIVRTCAQPQAGDDQLAAAKPTVYSVLGFFTCMAIHIMFTCKAAVQDAVDLMSEGRRKSTGGNTGVPMI